MSLKNEPLILLSFVIVSRNRRISLLNSISSFLALEGNSFEIIVSDNSDSPLQPDQLDQYFGEGTQTRIRLLRPSRYMEMCEHWEWALGHATGSYVAMVTDKIMVYPWVADLLDKLLRQRRFDLVSWTCDVVEVDDPDGSERLCRASPSLESETGQSFRKGIELVNPIEELSRCRYNIYNQFEDGYSGWYRGKLIFGCASSELISKIKSSYGSVFPGMSPDLTSRVLAMSLACDAVDMCFPLYFLNSSSGNGAQMNQSVGSQVQFAERNLGVEHFPRLPIPNLYSSITNFNMYDWFCNQRNSTNPDSAEFDAAMLVEHAIVELGTFPFSSDEERKSQWNILVRFAENNGCKVGHSLAPIPARLQLPSWKQSIKSKLVRSKLPLPIKLLAAKCLGLRLCRAQELFKKMGELRRDAAYRRIGEM